MFLIVNRETGEVLKRLSTEKEAIREISRREGIDVRIGCFEPCSYMIRQEAIPYDS